LLREELKEPRNYFVILEALSLGKTRLSEIINETGFDKGISSRYISILNSLQITTKEIPVTEKIPEKSRKGIYFIDDNFFNFWFRFVFKNRTFLEENRINEVVKKINKAMIELLARNYERVACDILRDTIFSKKLTAEFEVYGRWWDKKGEIDIVALNYENREILFGEVKWTNKKVGIDIYEDLKRKSEMVEWWKGATKKYFALFSKSGFTDDMLKTAEKEKVYLFHKDNLISAK
jgi:AAA+ ATPase superfamily predicted ATPase